MLFFKSFSDPVSGGTYIADFVIAILMMALADVLFRFVTRRWFAFIYSIIFQTLILVFWFCDLGLAFYLTIIPYLVGEALFISFHFNEIKTFLSSAPARRFALVRLLVRRTPDYTPPSGTYDEKMVVNEVFQAVKYLSSHASKNSNIVTKNATGAIIVFIKNDDLCKGLPKNGPTGELAEENLVSLPQNPKAINRWISGPGLQIDSLISAPLLENIFYEGAPLHDGAVLVKNDKIVRARVFFNFSPSVGDDLTYLDSNGVTVHAGARHRAALSISKESDALAVLVSEETGNIELFYQGKRDPVKISDFPKKFQFYLDLDSEGTSNSNEGLDPNEEIDN